MPTIHMHYIYAHIHHTSTICVPDPVALLLCMPMHEEQFSQRVDTKPVLCHPWRLDGRLWAGEVRTALGVVPAPSRRITSLVCKAVGVYMSSVSLHLGG